MNKRAVSGMFAVAGLTFATVTTMSGCRGSGDPSFGGFGGAGGAIVDPSGTGGGFCNGMGSPTSGGLPVASSGGTSGGGSLNFLVPAQPQYGATITREVAPPPISGGTLLVLRDGHTAVAADPDRDKIYVVDLTAKAIKTTIALTAGDEPGRAVEDAAGRVHIALRRGGAVVMLQPPAFNLSERQAICAAPRGLAYDATADRVHVACADGALVSLAAAGGPAVRTVQLDRDLRDVVVDGDHLVVSRFRSAQLLTVDGNGQVMQRLTPPTFRSFEAHNGQTFAPAVAWRMVGMPGGGVAVMHQRGLTEEVTPSFGGYGSGNPCDSIVQSAVLVMNGTSMPKSVPAIPGMVLPVDLAVSPDGKRVAMISAGNATNAGSAGQAPQLPRVFAAEVSDVSDPDVGCRTDGTHGPCTGGFGGAGGGVVGSGGAGGGFTGDVGPTTATGGASGSSTAPSSGPGAPAPGPSPPPPTPIACNGGTHPGELPQVVGEPIALAYAGDGKVVVQTREPAALHLATGGSIALSTDSREDTGHTVFHSNAGGFMACASCHPEGAEDGRTWNFACEGERRTQSLAAGISGTEPFHWNGDMNTFPVLMQSVFVERMSGPKLAPEQTMATLHWIDHQPRVPVRTPVDPASVDRGRALFNDTKVACTSCHSGARFTNNKTADVGTKGMFQVPSLLGIGSRAPFMHDGCAATLADRFGICGGGDKHGVTSQLAPGQITDLVNYLDTL